jgi:hypothetical protein
MRFTILPSPLSLFATWFVLQAAAAPAASSHVLTPQDFKQTIADGVWCVLFMARLIFFSTKRVGLSNIFPHIVGIVATSNQHGTA